MSKIYIIYWSQTGNTLAMAAAIGEGISEAGKEASVIEVSSASIDDIINSDVFALGCPSMGVEVLEDTEMEPFVCEVEKIVKGKKLALFGSYGWGDGEWMRDWETRMKNAGAILVNNKGLICNESPDADGIEECKMLGKTLANI